MHFGDKKRKAEHINSNAIKDADAPLESVQYRFKTADAPMLNQRKNKHVMMKRKFKKTLTVLWSLTLAGLLCIGTTDLILPERIAVSSQEEMPDYPCISYTEYDGDIADGLGSVTTVNARLFGIVPIKKIEVQNFESLKLIPGGMTLGVKLLGDGVAVVGMAKVESGGKNCSPAEDAGLAAKDIILKINGTPIKTVAALTKAIENSEGKTLHLVIRRDKQEKVVDLTPVRADSDGKYKSGMWVKDVSSGIGTVTFINPETGEFGALGHGICDKENGALAPSSRGVVTDCVVTGIVKGQKGTPGELRGYLKSNKIGTLLKNTDCGVFGVLTEFKGEALPLMPSNQVKVGKAVLRTALDGEEPTDYEIEITELGRGTTKCFTVKVTDPRLLEKTGGIVQGMSGSPIIQDGKLIGAVTHVMINEPTTGYGIFIENMLNAANIPMAKAS